MTNTKRRDEHSPTNFVPENYRYVNVLDLYAGTEKDDVSALAVNTNAPTVWTRHVEQTREAAMSFENNLIGEHPRLSQCSICGHHIRYAVVWAYEPEGEFHGFITSGLDCAENVDAARASELRDKVGALREFVAGMRRSVRDAEQAHREAPTRSAADEEADTWIGMGRDHADIAAFLNEHAVAHTDMPSDDCILCSFALQLEEKGRLSERQAQVARDIAERAEPLLPPEGEGIEVVGVVRATRKVTLGRVTIDVPERRRGMRRVMPYRVWLPVRRQLPPGTKVRFVATLHASRNDPKFMIATDVTGQAILG